MPREILRIVEAAQAQNIDCTVKFRLRVCAIGQRFIDVEQAAELLRILMLRISVVIVHCAIAAARLQNAMVDCGVDHLRQHELRWTRKLLYADR